MTIEAMKQMANYIDTLGGDSKKYRQAIAEAEKLEPVAWGVDWGKDGQQSCVSIVKRKPNGGIEVVAIEYNPTPSPSQRQWVGLTKNEVEQTLIDYNMGALPHRIDCIRAIEAKLKEKNT